MKKFINNLLISQKIFRKEKKKIITLCIIFLLTTLMTIIVGSMSLNLDKAFYIKDTDVGNRVVSFQDDEINPSIINYAESFEDNTIVSVSQISASFDSDIDIVAGKEKVLTGLAYFSIPDLRYDFYNKYDTKNVGKDEFGDPNAKEIVTKYSLPTGPAVMNFEYEGATHSVDIVIVASETSVDYMSQGLFDYFKGFSLDVKLAAPSYTFSFDNVRDTIDFYQRCILLDITLETVIKYPGITASKIVKNLKQAGMILCLLSIVILVTLMISFVNMLVILLMDKQKNVGLLKAQGLSNKRMCVVLTQGILFWIFISSIFATIGAILLMPVANNLLNSIFLGHFLNNAVLPVSIPFALFIPFGSFILISLPCILFTIYKSRTSAIDLILR